MDKLSEFVTRWFYSEHDPKVPDVFRQANRFKEKTMSQSIDRNAEFPQYDWCSLQDALSTIPSPKAKAGRLTYHAYATRLENLRLSLTTQPPVDYAMFDRYIRERVPGYPVSKTS